MIEKFKIELIEFIKQFMLKNECAEIDVTLDDNIITILYRDKSIFKIKKEFEEVKKCQN